MVLQDNIWEEWDQRQHPVSRAAHKTNSVVVVTIVDTDDEDASSRTASCSPREQESSTPEHSISEVTVISVQTSSAHLENGLAHSMVPNSNTLSDSIESSEITSDNISQDNETLFFDHNVDVSSPQDKHVRANEGQEELQLNPFIYKINPLAAKNYVIRLKERATRGRHFRDNVEHVTVNTSSNVCSYDGVRNVLTGYSVISSPIDYSKKGTGDEVARNEDYGDRTMIDDVSDDVELEDEEPIYRTKRIKLDTETSEANQIFTVPEMEDCNSSVLIIESSSNHKRREMAEKEGTESSKRRSKRINRLNGEKKQKCSDVGLGRSRAKQLTKKVKKTFM